MVVGREQNVETGVADGVKIFIGGTEGWVTAMRASAKRHFQIAHGNVGCLNLWAD